MVLQHLAGIAMAPAVFWAGDRYFGRIAGAFAGTVAALSPVMTLVEHHVIPDYALAILILAAVVAVCELAIRPRIDLRLAALAGAIIGLAALTKPSGQVLIAVVPIVIGYATRSWRDTLRTSAVALAAMLALVGPWVVYNAIRFDHPTISSQAGTTLWLRAFDQDKYPVPTDTEDARFAKSVYDQRLSQLTPAEREDTTDTYVSVFNAFLSRGDSIYDANHALGSIAREAIHQYLGSYATGTVRNIAEYSTDNFDLGDAKAAYLADSHDVAFDHPRYITTRIAWVLADILAAVGWIAAGGLLAAPALIVTGERRSRIAALAMLSAWVAIAVAGSLTNFVEARFAAQIAPLQWLLEGAVLGLLVTALRARRQPQSAQ
jgi:4-amino-4-deoxy-L-arabinose transferase-like glycosyltransferase